ncbi:alcohol dehydrogenase [Mycena kentingensis (nom. inval.)]|nr:alcohol dehydrogenase [Mycena kentingensis (nom. inval.)]
MSTDSDTDLVECGCSQCPPGTLVHRSTKRRHDARDEEGRVKGDVSALPEKLSAKEYLQRRRARLDIASTPSPANPPPSYPDPDVPMLPELPPDPTPLMPQSDTNDTSDSMDTGDAPDLRRPRANGAEPSRFWFWQNVLLFIAWLHIHDHLSHRACNLLLKGLAFIFLTAKLLRPQDKVPVSLRTVFKKLGLEEDIKVRAMCPKCRRTYPAASPADLVCAKCAIPLFHAPPASPSSTAPTTASPNPKPILQALHVSFSSLIIDFLNRDENESACEAYLTRQSIPGKLADIQDGEICRTLKGPDGRPFFNTADDRPDPDELRIGVCMGEDGFAFTRTKDAASHTTGVASFCVTGLPQHLRYRPRNLLPTDLSPGPHDQTCDEFNHSFSETVTELVMLWETGIRASTRKYPSGRRVRVALICACCDHPAMCKCGGFGDHASKLFPCTCCKITHADIQTLRGLIVDGFKARDAQHHRCKALEYAALDETNKKLRDAFAAKWGARYFDLLRLPYFDPIRQIIIDPMHCIFLGIVKTQWLDAWIREPAPVLRKRTEKNTCEIDQIHDYLQAMEMPSWVARLPNQVGYPAGGNLTSDEWKGMLLVFLPLIIPHVWAEWYPVAESDYAKSLLNRTKKEQARLERIKKNKAKAGDDKPVPRPKPIRMREDDADLLLKLAAFCKIILGGTIDAASLPRAQQLLEDYLAGFLKNHPDLVKPNFHYITHIFRIIHDFGPVYGFWTFLFERLNKLLKSYDTNNHGNGELEVTFIREFFRDVHLRELLRQYAQMEAVTPEDQCLVENAWLILASDSDMRGTLAAMAAEIETLSADTSITFSLGPWANQPLDQAIQNDLLEFYAASIPSPPVVARNSAAHPANAVFLYNQARIHDFFIRDGRRINTSKTLGQKANSSLIQIDLAGTRYVGEILRIMTHNQPGVAQSQHLLDVRWLRRDVEFDMSPWAPYPELEIYAWVHGVYLQPGEPGPPHIIPLDLVISQASRLTVELQERIAEPDGDDVGDEEGNVESETRDGTKRKIWFTAGLTRDVIVV